MSIRRMLLTVAVPFCLPAITFAKPPDLPVDQGIQLAQEPSAPAQDPRVTELFRQAEQDREEGRVRQARLRASAIDHGLPTRPNDGDVYAARHAAVAR